MALKDFPAIEAEFNKLVAKKEAIRAKSLPLRAKRDALLAKMRPMFEEEKALIAEYRALEQPLVEIDMSLAAMAQAAGGKSLGAGN